MMTEDFKRGFILGLAQKPIYLYTGKVNKSSVHKLVFKISGGETFTLPSFGVTDGTSRFGTISWGDGTSEAYNPTTNISHTYNDTLVDEQRLITINCLLESISAGLRTNQRLIKFQIGNGTTTIYQTAFQYCSNLVDLRLPQSLKTVYYGLINGNNEYDGIPISSLIIPPNIVNWNSEAFYYNPYLNVVRFESGLKTIGTKAFYHSRNLRYVYIPTSIIGINNEAFAMYSGTSPERISEMTIYYDGTQAEWNAINFGSNVFQNRPSGSITISCTDGDVTI